MNYVNILRKEGLKQNTVLHAVKEVLFLHGGFDAFVRCMEGFKKKKKVTMIHQSYLGVRRMYVLSLKKNQTKILPWLQGPPLHTPLLVVDVDSPEPSKLARAGAEWAGGQRGREFTGNFKKNKKRKKSLKKVFIVFL